ncbi:MAG TPA: low temperature requirement protein A [Solirubrobacteraceae bacterium]|nr:low temperature requirement protein A [Solirubrobacteraceae bacterium]
MASTADLPATAAAERVTTLELFFDLVFVFTVTQLTAVLTHDLSWKALGHAMVMLALIWWMYAGYAWLTNSVSTREVRQRAILLGGMAGYLVLALAVPDAFDGSGLAFGIGYLIVVSVHASLFIWTASAQSSRAFLGIAPYNLFNAMLVVVGGAIGGTAQFVLWTVAALLEWATPWVANRESQSSFVIAPAHFVERHGLVVIVAIGESVVAVGIGAAGLPVDAKLIAAAVLGLLLSAALWWAYFGADDDEQAVRALGAAPAERQPWIALQGFGVAHYFLLLGIVLVAAGLKKAIAHPYDEFSAAEALTLGGGVALFLAADVVFRTLLGLGRSPHRAVAAVLALATIVVGATVNPAAQLAVLVVVLAAALAGERTSDRVSA